MLVFAGVFRGLLDSRARPVEVSMKVGAARAIAGIVASDGVAAGRIVPSIFDARVVPAVAREFQTAAASAGLGAAPAPAKTAPI